MSQLKYHIPEDLNEYYDKYVAYFRLKDDYARKAYFGFKRAVKCGLKAEKYRSKFWNCVTKLYPELAEKQIKYHQDGRYCTAIEKAKGEER